MRSNQPTVNIFNYFDYRKFLKDYYEYRKKQNPHFSHRFIGMKVGFNASTFTRVLQKKRNLSLNLAVRITEVFKFNKKEKDYFQLLVLFDQADEHLKKKQYFEKILTYRKHKLKSLSAQQFEYFDKWYYVAIRELLAIYKFKNNYAELAAKLAPAITPKEAETAVRLLESLGLIKKTAQGYYRPTEESLSTGDEWRSLAITNFQLTGINLAAKAIDRFPREAIDYSTMTLRVSESGLGIIQEKIKLLRQELAEDEAEDKDADAVYQINFNAFPLTKNIKK